MANYKVYEETKTITVSDKLTEIEVGIVSAYIKDGYKVKEKRTSTAVRVNDLDIINYFDSKKDEDGKAKYEEKKNEKIKDKNGKKRTAGFLVAMKWFKENYAEAYETIKNSKSKKK